MGDLTRTLRALLPTGAAFRPRVGSTMGKLLAAIGAELDEVRQDIDRGFLDRLPSRTTALAEWEAELGLPTVASLSTAQRRARIAALLGDKSALAKVSLEAFLQSYGFSVWVHQWTSFPSVSGLGTGDVERYFAPLGSGYVLANGGRSLAPIQRNLAGQTWMVAGEVEALAGYAEGYLSAAESAYIYQCRVAAASSPSGYRYPNLVVIGGQAFGTFASVPIDRRAELEALVLSRGRASSWHGFLITYT